MTSTVLTSTPLRALLGQNRETRYLVSGEVEVEGGVGIGAGVLLRANPGCRIRIERGVCIGTGSILHACGGSLIVEAGATLGMGVLVIGQGTIGKNACVGSETTVLNCSVLSHAVIPPRSLLGDPTRLPETWEGAEPELPKAQEAVPEPSPSPLPSSPVAQVEEQTRRRQEAQKAAEQTPEEPRPLKLPKLNGIPGHSELERLLGKIYPHRQAFSAREGRF